MSIYKKLLNIQAELKAPKNQFNSFGNYKYRSLEDILEAVKPLMIKEQVTLIISDEVIEIGGWHYIKATAKLIDLEDNSSIEATALAREAETKKGMDASQITGATSSYARKYCLNGLFAIDDNKDADATNTHNTSSNASKSSSISEKQLKLINTLISKTNSDRNKIKTYYKVNSLKELTANQANALITQLKMKEQS